MEAEAEVRTIDDLVNYIEGDTNPLSTTAPSSKKKKKRKKANKSDKMSSSDQTPAPFNPAQEEKPKKPGAIPKKKAPKATSNSALEGDHDSDCNNSKPEAKTDRMVNYTC